MGPENRNMKNEIMKFQNGHQGMFQDEADEVEASRMNQEHELESKIRIRIQKGEKH